MVVEVGGGRRERMDGFIYYCWMDGFAVCLWVGEVNIGMFIYHLY